MGWSSMSFTRIVMVPLDVHIGQVSFKEQLAPGCSTASMEPVNDVPVQDAASAMAT